MNTMRIAALSLSLGLAGAFTAAWGAESVMSLISTGEAIQNEVNSARSAVQAMEQKNKDLVAEGKSLAAQQYQYQQDYAAWQKDDADVKQRTSEYKAKCEGQKLDQDQYKACAAEQQQLAADIAKVNGEVAPFAKRHQDISDAATKHNAAIGDFKQAEPASRTGYSNALTKQQTWLEQARNLVGSDSFKTSAVAQKANCPDVSKAPKTPEALAKMSDDVLTCLKKVSTGG